ncbi:hypothetical protein [Limosilactobacillus reuteri]|uniref:hypothetical protein n=1 Tax=Limosilactobacillus reuteri TaxID=1598 RepID=UPI00080C8FB5|nr:hypothetical protein [Limosilactobacillus reuteri]ANU51336.1 hypothetical protein A4V07_03180 [Limosilactobacillus reuteri]OXE59183.1 hypothetical protein ADH69_00725 [Limosilactobacillus reuteri]QQR14721.1 hypothetical protein I5Q80_00240 [Limosilactobacillus reuteri]
MNDGLDDLINHIDKMQKNAERLNGKNEFTNDELFSRPFMLQHTYNTYSLLDEFLNASKFADIPFEEIPDDEWDEWVANKTDFQSWKEMQTTAYEKLIAKKARILIYL